ncbi:MAG: LysM peptidoglycan-binding domain-containing protein [Clostridiales bacterium]|nr:LysM peptidoglycan-binding domain-containing protein [Clostridiales bacterium]
MKKSYRIKSRARFTVFVLVVFLMMAGAVNTVFGLDAHAASEPEYLQIEVESGDTLWDLARDFGPDDQDVRRVIKHICKINNVSPETLQPGQVLLIPVEL